MVDTVGFNNLSWLDARGHGHSEEMRVEERFHRRDFGHLKVTLTVNDPKAFSSQLRSTSSRAFFQTRICSSATASKTKETPDINRARLNDWCSERLAFSASRQRLLLLLNTH